MFVRRLHGAVSLGQMDCRQHTKLQPLLQVASDIDILIAFKRGIEGGAKILTRRQHR
jgi:hypothetical protein